MSGFTGFVWTEGRLGFKIIGIRVDMPRKTTGEQCLKPKSAVSLIGFTGFVSTEGRLGFKYIRVGEVLI